MASGTGPTGIEHQFPCPALAACLLSEHRGPATTHTVAGEGATAIKEGVTVAADGATHAVARGGGVGALRCVAVGQGREGAHSAPTRWHSRSERRGIRNEGGKVRNACGRQEGRRAHVVGGAGTMSARNDMHRAEPSDQAEG